MPLRTTLCSTAAPSRRSSQLHTPGGAIPNHELFIDLGEPMGGRPMVIPAPLEDPEFFLSIRDVIVKRKQPGGTPIDAIHISFCSAESPDYRLWEALEEAEPSHLELITTDMYQQCNYGGLGKIKLKHGAWPLKSMYLNARFGDGNWEEEEEEDGTKQPPSFPACYAGLETLILDSGPSGDSLYFYPEGGATNLKSLRILETESVVAFARTLDCNPKIAETLKSLAIVCMVMESEVGFVRRMKRFFKEEAKKLEVVELVVKHPMFPISKEGYEDDVHMLGLAKLLPNTLTTLSFSGPANTAVLKDMDNWIESASSPSWLANLKKIGFKLTQSYVETQNNPLTKERTLELELTEKKVETFLNLLRQRQPPVEVIQPRSRFQLAYPIAL
ncbi:hypothetical protein EST38_g7066 [Candolleomyces aberdarensis]|uniref:Uncharacterized protein n=1 Tax=Candolleomyces aberdarensis TaxID=2316362 RepID=A0A4Q2DI65_9AGAR|nr:hypothetical protein EST38_g7066 [Candolleomyces aberdarensis]